MRGSKICHKIEWGNNVTDTPSEFDELSPVDKFRYLDAADEFEAGWHTAALEELLEKYSGKLQLQILYELCLDFERESREAVGVCLQS